MKTENQTVAAKQEYQAPELNELGRLTELTLTNGGVGGDGTTQTLT
jgi:hypothetical protein